uniref:Uncharacterized protein n=1 Tax=Oryza punctata TaxID=4537 RepID=A0A0E0JIH7_ORYPU
MAGCTPRFSFDALASYGGVAFSLEDFELVNLMEEGSNKREGLPQLLDLIPDEKKWKLREALGPRRSRNTGFEGEEDKKLDLKLGLPGLIEEDKAETSRDYRLQQERPSLSLGFFPKHSKTTSSTTTTTGAKRGFIDTVEAKTEGYNDQKQQARAGCGKELAVEEMIAAERKKGCCPPPPPSHGAPATPARNRPQTQGSVFVSTAKRLRVLRSSELSHTLIGATARV